MRVQAKKLKAGRHNSTENAAYGYASRAVLDNNESPFYFQGVNHSLAGRYTIKRNVLTLMIKDDKTYIFTTDDGKLIFGSDDWTEKMLDKGAIFQLSNE